MKNFLLSTLTGALLLTGTCVAFAADMNELCGWSTRGIVAATPCMARHSREDAAYHAANWFPGIASLQQELALRLETLAARRQSGELTEEQAVSIFTQMMSTHVAEHHRQEAIDRRRAVATIMSRRGPSMMSCIGNTCFTY